MRENNTRASLSTASVENAGAVEMQVMEEEGALPPQVANRYSWEVSAKGMCAWPVLKYPSVNLSCGYQEPVPISA